MNIYILESPPKLRKLKPKLGPTFVLKNNYNQMITCPLKILCIGMGGSSYNLGISQQW
jgi:hypothetical protein